MSKPKTKKVTRIMQLGVSEILEAASKIEDRQARIQYLREKAIKGVQIVLQYALDPNIKWLLPSGLPPFNKNKIPGCETMLLAEARRLYLFVEGGNDNLKQEKREVLFIQLLEMLAPEDCALIEAIKEKRLPYPNLEYDVIKEAFPFLLPEIEQKSTLVESLPEPTETVVLEKKKRGRPPLNKTEPKKRGAKKAISA